MIELVRNIHRSREAAARLLVLVSVALFSLACGEYTGGDASPPDPFSSFGSMPSGVSEAENVQFYSETVWPILNQETCGNCHTLAGGRPFPFADANRTLAYRTIIDNFKVNFDTPSDSRIVVQVAANQHHCWSNDCSADGLELLVAIEDWIARIEAAGGSSTGGTAVGAGTLVSDVVTAADGVEDEGGERYTRNLIAFWKFDEKDPNDPSQVIDLVYDTSGVPPAMNLQLDPEVQVMDAYGIDMNAGRARAVSGTTRKLYDHIADPYLGTGQFSVEMWFAPANTNQMTDMVRYGDNVRLRQRLYQYDLRVRSMSENIPGDGDIGRLLTYDVDRDLQAGLQQSVVTFDRLTGMKVYVNGEYTDDVDENGGALLWNWRNDGARLTLGERGDEGFYGQIRMLAIYKEALPPSEIRKNFLAGVGLRLNLSFDIGQFGGPGSRIEMSLSQIDDESYLLCQPTVVTQNLGLKIRGMRVKVNGNETGVGQAFSRLNTVVTQPRQQIHSGCTIVANPSGPDDFQLAFEGLGGWIDPLPDVDWGDITYDYTGVQMPPTNGVRDFARVNESMAAVTSVPTSTSSVENDYQTLVQQLPGAPDLGSFVASNQVGIAKLGFAYCHELVEDAVERDVFFDQGPAPVEWTAVPAVAFMNDAVEDKRLRVTGPIVDKMVGDLTVQPAPGDVENRLLSLTDDLIAAMDAECTACGGTCDACTDVATRNIVKGVCTAVLASGAVHMH